MDCYLKFVGQERISCPGCQHSFESGFWNPILVEREQFSDLPKPMNFVPNAKIEALLTDLKMVREKEPSVKSVVFSQWTKMLSIIEANLEKDGFGVVSLTGDMSRQKRFESMKQFNTDDNIQVFLVSLKSGGVGLTLTRASRVYIMEPYWNPAVENQAIDRVHRLGQTRPVTAVRYLVKNSIEENMIILQEYKVELAQAAFKEGKKETKKRSSKEINREKMMSIRILFGLEDGRRGKMIQAK